MQMRSNGVKDVIPQQRFEIEVDGQKVIAYEGESIAGVLFAIKRRILRRTQKLNMPRGVFCGIGICHDCLMVVDGVPNIRACITLVKEGMKIETQIGVSALSQVSSTVNGEETAK